MAPYDYSKTNVWTTWTSTDTSDATSATWDYWTSDTCTASSTLMTYPGNHWVTWVSEEEFDNQQQEQKHQGRLKRRKARALLPKKERRRQQAIKEQWEKDEHARQLRLIREQRKEQRRKKKAEATAWILLEDIITPKEAKRYKETGRLLVHGQKYDWLIKKPTYEGSKPGVVRVDKGKLVDICIHTNDRKDSELPEADRIMSLALSAKFNEKAFNEECNKHGDVQMPDEYLRECGNF